MDQAALETQLGLLISNWEDEVVEFKRAGEAFSSGKLGQYVSALANEANLRGRTRGWLVFGVDNESRTVVGTPYKEDLERLQADKMQVLNGTVSFTFRDIHVLQHAGGRVILFEVPAAPRGMPIAWNGHYYGRAGESLVALGQDKLDEIRGQTLATDWTAQIVEGASLDDLDSDALSQARERFASKHANLDVASWPDAAFLDRARVTIDGGITRTALLLLGKATSAWRLNPHPAEITWNLTGEERAYEHFGPPFLLATSRLFAKIRNIQVRLLPANELLAHEVAKYDQKVVLEALHNCIAHQDYARNARVVVTEHPDRLVFENMGNFYEGKPEDYVSGDKRPPRYRNPFLAQAMTELNMIDHMGYGIHDIYQRQRKRFFPLPDFDLQTDDMVRLTIHGRIVDPAYSRLLMQRTGLDLVDVLALDRVQKGLPITDDAIKHLRRNKLIEGRKPKFHVSAQVAAATSTMADYVRTRAQDDEFYAKLLKDYLAGAGTASRQEINLLLLNKLSDALTTEQKLKKVANLLTKFRRQGLIVNTGPRAAPQWQLAE
ncbi:RNA-binding domain-containing protein [Brevundimonas sp.]|uniref:RNA-binding domain-containing protein n=1 Tax=Brevundimonas sp. TaxID=1871086 RepID=UPI003AF76C07